MSIFLPFFQKGPTIRFVVPVVTTGDATSITGSGATLNGTVTNYGQNVVSSFEYGINESYGSTTASEQGVIAGNIINYPITAVLTGLTPETTYHFRIISTNASGTVYGLDQTFITSI